MSNITDACTSYMTCGLFMHMPEINLATVGAIVLLIARLVKDVPDAYYAVRKILNKKKKKKRGKRGKSNR